MCVSSEYNNKIHDNIFLVDDVTVNESFFSETNRITLIPSL